MQGFTFILLEVLMVSLKLIEPLEKTLFEAERHT